MKGLHEYLHMGGDGVFIWSAYLAATILLAGISTAIMLRNRHVKKRTKMLESIDKKETEIMHTQQRIVTMLNGSWQY